MPDPTTELHESPDRGRRRGIADGLRALADAIEHHEHPVPGPGRGARRIARLTVVPMALHDAVCGWRIATPQAETGILGCAGCGLGYAVAEVTS